MTFMVTFKVDANPVGKQRARYVFVENSPMLTSRGLGRVLGDLASMGFDARWGVLGAADVGAPHQRDRIWIVAKWRGQLPHAQHDRIRWWEQQQESLETTNRQMADPDIIRLDEPKTKRDRTYEQQVCQNEFDYGSEVWGEAIGCGELGDEKELAYSTGSGLQGQGQSEQPINSKTYEDWKAGQSANVRESDFWATEPNVGRVVNGMASRVDRIKAHGNGQVFMNHTLVSEGYLIVKHLRNRQQRMVAETKPMLLALIPVAKSFFVLISFVIFPVVLCVATILYLPWRFVRNPYDESIQTRYL